MTDIFQLPILFGFSANLKFEPVINTSVNNQDHIVIKHDEPTLEFSYSASLLIDAEKDYAKNFFLAQQGSQNVFLFEDPIDFFATNELFDTGYGITTRGVVLEDTGTFFLAKAYALTVGINTYIIYRPITRPNIVTIYDNLGVAQVATIDNNTGIITSGGGSNQYWEGSFYVPVRFQSDILPITVESFRDPDDLEDYNRYKIPDLKFIEVKEADFNVTHAISNSYNHTYQLPFEKDISIDNTSKTDIFRNEANREIRESLNYYRYTISQSNQLLLDKTLDSFKIKEYLIGLYRLCLGSSIPIRIIDDLIGFNHFFRFDGDISFEMTAFDDNEAPLNTGLFSVSSLNLKQYAGNTFFYCHCWKITRTDNTVIAVTNYNRPLIIDSITYSPIDAIASTSSTYTSELNISAIDARGAFGAITELDLIIGKYDEAEVEYFLANWQSKVRLTTLFEGNIGGYDISYLGANGKTFRIECLSKTEAFNRNIPRVTSTTCHHTFAEQGTNKCNVTITSNVRESTTVVSSNGDTITTAQSTTPYAGGVLEFTSGLLIGRKITIVDVTGNDVILLYPPEIAPSIGDTITLTRRCGKTIGDCYSYNNAVNFGGQPLAPTTDSKIAGADNDNV